MAAGSIVIGLLMKTGQFETDTKRAEKRLREFEKAAAQVGKVIGTAIAVGATAAVAGFTMIINKQRDLIDSQAKLAQSMNTTYTSLSNLERAGQLAGVGFDQINTAARQLDINIGRAAQGVKTQADAFNRLGLSAEDLVKIPLDERIAAINAALRDNVPAYERSAVAAEIFGAKNAAAIQRMDPDTIAEAARQVRLFGLNLSDVDAAKVEMANDAFSTFDLLIQGIQKQMTVAFAPALKALGDEFLRASEEAGGLGTVVMDVADDAVRFIGFIIDAVEGFIRVLRLSLEVGRMMALGLSGSMLKLADMVVNGPLRAVNELIEQMNRVPGVNIGPVQMSGIGAYIQSELAAAEKGFEASKAKIEDLLTKPLAGDRMVRAWERALVEAQAAAEKAVSNRASAGPVIPASPGAPGRSAKPLADDAMRTYEAIQRQIRALETQAVTFNMTSKEATLYKLAMDGATAAQIEQARTILESIDALEKAKEEQRLYADELERVKQLTGEAETEKQIEDYLMLARALRDGRIEMEGFHEGLRRIGILADESATELDDFAKNAAESFQSSLEEFLFDPFAEGLDGMLKGFGQFVQRAIAQAVAADLTRRLFGEVGGGSGSGFLGGLIGSFGSMLFGGARAGGGDVMPGSAYLVGERGPEMFVPRTAGTVLSNAQTTGGRNEYNINVTVPHGSPQETRRAAASGAREALAFMSNAGRYA